jgi:hypothetical protein
LVSFHGNLDSEYPFYKRVTAAATDDSPDAAIDADMAISDTNQTARKCSTPDEDVNDEIVDDLDVISDVKLPDKPR